MTDPYCSKAAFAHFGAGTAVGGSGLAAGCAIGMVGDAGVRSVAQQPKLFVGMILILIFAEALGLYGLIVAPFSKIRSQMRKRSGLMDSSSSKLPSTRHCAWMRANSAMSSHSLLLPYPEVRMSSLRMAFRQIGFRMLLWGSSAGSSPHPLL